MTYVRREARRNSWIFDQSNDLEPLLDTRAIELYRVAPLKSLRGEHSVSAETEAPADRYRALAWLILDSRERFFEMISDLPNAVQDVMLQYYLLGRNQRQIGELFGKRQTWVWQILEAGTLAMCAKSYGKGRELPDKFKRAIRRLGRLRMDGREIKRWEPTFLGSFCINRELMSELRKIMTPETTDGSLFKDLNGGSI